jgi:hypothetical protein
MAKDIYDFMVEMATNQAIAKKFLTALNAPNPGQALRKIFPAGNPYGVNSTQIEEIVENRAKIITAFPMPMY